MQQIQVQTVLLLCCFYNSQSFPFEATTRISQTTNTNNVYVLSALEYHEEVPTHAIEIKPDESHNDIPDDHILKKKIIALPINKVTTDTKVLTNDQGHVVVAKGIDNSDEDLMTAEAIVFRPLFTYRRQLAQRRRVYLPSRNQRQPVRDNQNYVPSCNRRKNYSDTSLENSRPSRTYPSYYPMNYQNARFPALI